MSKVTMKIKARDEFVSFAEKALNTKFGALTKMQQSRVLVQFYIKQIHNKLKPEISDEDLELALVDGSGDIGIDFLHRDDSHVTIIQAKYRASGTKEPHEEVSYFQSVLRRVGDSDLKISDRLLAQLSDVDLKNDTFSLIYLTFGDIANQAQVISRQKPPYPEKFPRP